MDSIYETLMSLPLLKGVSEERLKLVVSSTPLHFLKYLEGDTIINEGDLSTHLRFIINGKARVTITNSNGRFKVSQTLTGPDVIAPEYLFVRVTEYPCSAVALEATGILQISKSDYVSLLRSDEVILFNYLNLLSAGAQAKIDGIIALTDGSLEERIAYWIVALTQRSGTDIVLSCRQRDLYSMFGVQRSAFYAVLDSLRERGIITYTPTEIRPVSRRALTGLLLNSDVD